MGVTLPPKDWPKHKLKFDFKGDVFRWNQDAPPVEEFNLQIHYQEPGEETYMRENLAAAVFSAAAGSRRATSTTTVHSHRGHISAFTRLPHLSPPTYDRVEHPYTSFKPVLKSSEYAAGIEGEFEWTTLRLGCTRPRRVPPPGTSDARGAHSITRHVYVV